MRTLTRTLVDDAENKEEPGAVAKPHFLASFDGCSAELEAQLRARFEGLILAHVVPVVQHSAQWAGVATPLCCCWRGADLQFLARVGLWDTLNTRRAAARDEAPPAEGVEDTDELVFQREQRMLIGTLQLALVLNAFDAGLEYDFCLFVFGGAGVVLRPRTKQKKYERMFVSIQMGCTDAGFWPYESRTPF